MGQKEGPRAAAATWLQAALFWAVVNYSCRASHHLRLSKPTMKTSCWCVVLPCCGCSGFWRRIYVPAL